MATVDPSTQLIASGGRFPDVTHERQDTTVPRQIWTDQTTSPIYSILNNSSYLPKENITSCEIRRAAIIGDGFNNSTLTIEFSQPVIKLNNGESVAVFFKEYDYSKKLDLSLANLFDYLQTEPTDIPANAESISFNVEIKSFQVDTLADGSVETNKPTGFTNITYDLLAKDELQNNLASLGSNNLKSDDGIYNFSKTYETNTLLIKNKNVFLIPKVKVKGPFNEKDLYLSLANISIEGASELPKDLLVETVIPTEYLLEQNYPNPFNPTTEIKYSILKDGFVTLKIYDILGREVKILVNEEKLAGVYNVSFDASNLSSGIYLYSITSGSFHQTRKMVLAK